MSKAVQDGFPQGFKAQRIGVTGANAISDLPPAHIAAHFSDHPGTAQALLDESYDKCFTPSSFIAEEGNRFSVGWFSAKGGRECVRQFSNLADAATDYLLFSVGRGRWAPPATED